MEIGIGQKVFIDNGTYIGTSVIKRIGRKFFYIGHPQMDIEKKVCIETFFIQSEYTRNGSQVFLSMESLENNRLVVAKRQELYTATMSLQGKIYGLPIGKIEQLLALIKPIILVFFIVFCPKAQGQNPQIMAAIDSCSAEYGIPREVFLGVGMKETRLGAIGVGAAANNLFGVRAYDWKGEKHKACSDCRAWRKYDSPEESVADFCKFIEKNYPYLFDGRPLRRWKLYGYGPEEYETEGYFCKFTSIK